jgi:hypothetical protein
MRKISFLFCLLAISCQKGDLGGTSTVSGTVYWMPYQSANVSPAPLPGITLYLKTTYAPGAGYLYTTTTDTAGNYVFNDLGNQPYWIYASLDSGGIQYAVDDPVTVGSNTDNLTLQFSTTGLTGFQVTAQDGSSMPIGNLKLWVFSSSVIVDDIVNEIMANAPATLTNTTNDSTGAIFSLVTDSSGIALATNLAPITYYINGYDSLYTGYKLEGMNSVTVTQGKITPVTVKLVPVPN